MVQVGGGDLWLPYWKDASIYRRAGVRDRRPVVTMRLALLLLAFGMSPVGFTTCLTAQTLPVPTLPPEPAPKPTPQPTPESQPRSPSKTPLKQPVAQPAEETGQARPRPWEYGLGAGVAWDSNIAFLRPDGPSGTAIIPTGEVARVLSSTRGQLRAEARGSWVGYPYQETLSRYYFDAGLRGDYRSSAQTTWRGQAHYWLGYSDSSPTLIEQGVPLPLVKTRSLTGELALTRQMGTRTSLHVEGRVLRTVFEDPDFVDGTSLRGTLSLERRLGVRDAVSVVYALEESGSYVTHFGSLQWAHTLSHRSAFLLEAGASHTPDAKQLGLDRSEGFFGGATFIRQIGRSSLRVYFRREVAPAFGFGGSRLESRAGLQADIPMGRDWRLRMMAYHIQPETSQSAGRVDPSSSDASADLGRRLGRHLTMSGEARYRRRGATPTLIEISAFQVALFLTIGSPEP